LSVHYVFGAVFVAPCPGCVVLSFPIDSSSSLCGCSSGGANWGTPISTFWRWRSGARESYIHSF
jgi:hypothetical protein